MEGEIVNRVANSKLKVIDLEDFYPSGARISLDIKDWLWEGLVLREKEFRAFVKGHDWSQYQNAYVALFCSTDAIIPDWAYMLISLKLQNIARLSVIGNPSDIESLLYAEIISSLDLSDYNDTPVIIKGCSKVDIPQSAYTLLISKIQPIVKSLMFGEACSTVPLYKPKKS